MQNAAPASPGANPGRAARCKQAAAMAAEGNPNSVSDAGVGALAARSAVLGARLNVKINAAGLKDRAVADALVAEAEQLAAEAERLEKEVLTIVEQKIG